MDKIRTSIPKPQPTQVGVVIMVGMVVVVMPVFIFVKFCLRHIGAVAVAIRIACVRSPFLHPLLLCCHISKVFQHCP